MNSKIENLDLETKWVEVAQNCRFEDEPGSLDKREPLSFLNSTAMGTATPIVGMFRYYTSSGLATWIAVSGTKAYSITDGGTATEIRGSLTDGKRCSFEVYRDKLIVSNGYDNIWTWDGDTTNNKTWELGGCKAIASASSGSMDTAAVYSYTMTMGIGTADQFVSGAVSNSVTTTTSGRVSLSQIPLGPVGVDKRRIYRTDGGGTSYKLLTEITDNTTTVYEDTVADGSLTTALPAVTDDMPKGSILKVHRERLFISGDPTYPNKIYYSNPYLPHFIQQTTNLDYMEISPEDGDEIMGIPIQLGVMVCIKKNSIRKVFVTSAVAGADPETWYADDPVAWIGSPAQWSITQTPNGVVFLGWDHWYIFDGASAQPIFDDFDTGDILEASYSDTFSFFHNENFLAAYTDKESAAQKHNRCMVFNLKREALSVDLWTGSLITGPNCFGAKTGDDEAGDLYFGDSGNGYIVKSKDGNSASRLRTKTEANLGTDSDIFVGGTENAPYIEIGDVVAAETIPDNIVIFWDSEVRTPGSGWVEITGYEDKLIKISTTALTTAAGTSHVHLLTGSIPMWTWTSVQDCGDSEGVVIGAHTHEVAANADASTPLPRNVKYRMFKSSSNTNTEFPDGAIIMWDQTTPPEGYQLISSVGYYLSQDTEDLAAENSSSHSHSFSIPTGTAAGNAQDSGSPSGAPTACPGFGHNHTVTGALSTEVTDTWEVDYVAFTFIKKIGETDTWDGVTKYCYALFAAATAASNGWTDVSSTYDTKFLKIGSTGVTTGAAANASHTHTAGTFTTSTESSRGAGPGGYHNQSYPGPHTHSVTLSASSVSAGAPPSVTFRLFKKVLGTMKDYNEAIGTTFTTGTWTAPSQHINADTLLKIYWNETITGSDNVLVYTRTGTSQALCEAAAWSAALTNPNGSDIASTASNWLQYKIVFSATDTVVSNPRVYFTNGYVVKYEYHGGYTVAESSVNCRYEIGFRNFNEPELDKVFKKIITKHEGTEGSFTVSWETENASGEFVVSLSDYPEYWDSYFPSDAMGKEINFVISKNDLYSFRISELKGMFSPYGLII
jgi:hypothetical protein